MDADFEARFDKALLDAKVAMERLIAHGAAAENAACAALCREMKCTCFSLALAGDFDSRNAEGDVFGPEPENWQVLVHDPCCPKALASIEERRATRPV